jgi:hypothetical protein
MKENLKSNAIHGAWRKAGMCKMGRHYKSYSNWVDGVLFKMVLRYAHLNSEHLQKAAGRIVTNSLHHYQIA